MILRILWLLRIVDRSALAASSVDRQLVPSSADSADGQFSLRFLRLLWIVNSSCVLRIVASILWILRILWIVDAILWILRLVDSILWILRILWIVDSYSADRISRGIQFRG